MINKDVLKDNEQLLKKQKREQEKIVSSMEKEIETLEKSINNVNLANAKNSVIKNLKIFSAFTKASIPYVLVATITFGGFSIFGLTPFNVTKKQKLSTIKEIDSLGNIVYEQQYKNQEDKNILIHYDAWQQGSSNYYKRTVKIYNLNNLSESKINEIILSKENIDIEEILGDPIYIKTELNSNVSLEELNSPGMLKALIYFSDGNIYKTVKAPMVDNILITFFYLICVAILEVAIMIAKDAYCTKTLKEKCLDIKCEYPSINVSEIKKKILIKKDNYKRLVGKKYEKKSNK